MLRFPESALVVVSVILVGCASTTAPTTLAADSAKDATVIAQESALSREEAHLEAEREAWRRAAIAREAKGDTRFVPFDPYRDYLHSAPSDPQITPHPSPVLNDGSTPGDANDTTCARRATDHFNRCKGEHCITEYDKALDACGFPR